MQSQQLNPSVRRSAAVAGKPGGFVFCVHSEVLASPPHIRILVILRADLWPEESPRCRQFDPPNPIRFFSPPLCVSQRLCGYDCCSDFPAPLRFAMRARVTLYSIRHSRGGAALESSLYWIDFRA